MGWLEKIVEKIWGVREGIVSGGSELKGRKIGCENTVNIKLTDLLVDSSMPYFQRYFLNFK